LLTLTLTLTLTPMPMPMPMPMPTLMLMLTLTLTKGQLKGSCVARPREFEYDEVLDRALQIFWSNGFKHTSMDILVGKLRINRASVYNTFGNKKRFFRTALEHYSETQLPYLLEPLRDAETSAQTQVYGLFCKMIELGGKGNSYRGCFVINSLNELSHIDAELAAICANTVNALKRELLKVVARGQRLGEFRNDVDSKVLTTHLLSTASGLMAMAKSKAQTAHLKNASKMALRLIAIKGDSGFDFDKDKKFSIIRNVQSQ
jgi:TetR/AcrR family transcriptional repressor of nem operon